MGKDIYFTFIYSFPGKEYQAVHYLLIINVLISDREKDDQEEARTLCHAGVVFHWPDPAVSHFEYSLGITG